jgi:hypothetical protein
MAVTAISSIVYGELIILDERDADGREKDFQVNILGRLRDDSRFDAGAYHQGMEDPRWLLHNDRLFLLTTAERGLPRLFLTELLDNGPGRPFGYPSNKPTVELVPQFEADYAQKNWMFVPADDALVSGANGDDQLLFVFRATPLHLVRVNPSDGKVYTVYQQTEEEYQSQRYSHNGTFKLSGSTHFIPLGQPVRDGQRHFLGVTHRNLPHAKVAGSELRKYESYFVRLTHYASENCRVRNNRRFPIGFTSYLR